MPDHRTALACLVVLWLALLPNATAQADALAACRQLATMRAVQAALPAATLANPSQFADLRAATKALGSGPAAAALVPSLQALLSLQPQLEDAHQALRDISQQSDQWLTPAEDLQKALLLTKSSHTQQAASAQLVMLTQRLGKSATRLLIPGNLEAESVYLLGKDKSVFADLLKALHEGSKALALPAVTHTQAKKPLEALLEQQTQRQERINQVLNSLQALIADRELHLRLQAPLRAEVARLQPLCGAR